MSTRWRELVNRLNAETSRAAREAFERAERPGAREFLWRPMAAFGRELVARSGPRRLDAAVLAAFGAVVCAAKLWEENQSWEQECLERLELGRLECVIQRGWRDAVREVLAASDGGEPIGGGRGATRRFSTPQGSVVVRRFRRGGAVRWLGSNYVGWSPRPLREFFLLVALRRRGLPVPEPIAAAVERRLPLSYRGMLVMSDLGGRSLHAHLQANPRAPFAAALARSLRSLHDRGLYHPDLNLSNVLVTAADESLSFAYVDLDRARLGPPLSRTLRTRSLERLRRSARKLDPAGRLVDDAELDRLVGAYWDDAAS